MKSPYDLARAEIGTVEWKNGSNPKVVGYFRDAGHAAVVDDATAWCAAFVGAMLKRAGMKGTGKLTARSYLEWGLPVDLKDAQPGDILVFQRGNSTWQGHVGFFVGRSGAMVRVLGGNQSDAVKEQHYPVSKLLGVRRAVALVAEKPDALTPTPVHVSKTPKTEHVGPVVLMPAAPVAVEIPRVTWWQALLAIIFGKGSSK
jgi:uncharacterized protein (TIGR02594 family)